LMRYRKRLPFPNIKYRQRKGKRDYYTLRIDDNGELHPVEVREEDKGKTIYLKPQPEDRKSWASLERKQLISRIQKPQLFKEMFIASLPVLLALVGFLIIFFMLKEVGGGLNNVASQIGQVATVCSQALG